jgi:hypothetical protein
MAPAVELAKHVSDTAFVPKGLRGNAPAIVAAIMYGDEVGLGPMQALAKIAVIDGRPSLSAEAQRALILAAGHDLWVVESTNTKVTVAGRRAGSEHASTITWTLDDAKRAGLAGRQNWRSYPRQMLMARATAELARLIFADAVGGLLATEELEDGELAEGDAPVVETTKRKRRSTAQPQTTVRVDPDANGAEPDLPPLPDEPFPTDESTEIPGASDSSPQVGGSADAPGPKTITQAQRRRLFALAREVGMEDEHLRSLVEEMTGTPSTKELSVEHYEQIALIVESRKAMA